MNVCWFVCIEDNDYYFVLFLTLKHNVCTHYRKNDIDTEHIKAKYVLGQIWSPEKNNEITKAPFE